MLSVMPMYLWSLDSVLNISELVTDASSTIKDVTGVKKVIMLQYI